jgi:hypothetical protein
LRRARAGTPQNGFQPPSGPGKKKFARFVCHSQRISLEEMRVYRKEQKTLNLSGQTNEISLVDQVLAQRSPRWWEVFQSGCNAVQRHASS